MQNKAEETVTEAVTEYMNQHNKVALVDLQGAWCTRA